MRVLHCVDAHAEGEPSRIVVGGVLDVPGTTMLEKMQSLEAEGDELRKLLLFEPRGSAPLSLDLVLPSAHPEADAGFLIMESCSYEGMSGSNTINTATVILETGIVPITEPVTSLVLEAPAGLVRVTADCRKGRRGAQYRDGHPGRGKPNGTLCDSERAIRNRAHRIHRHRPHADDGPSQRSRRLVFQRRLP